MQSKILMQPSKVLTEKDCYEELVRVVRIYCYQAVAWEETDFFRDWVKNILNQISEYSPAPDQPEKYPAYKELRRKAGEFVREPAESPARVMIRREEMREALEKAEAIGGLRVRARKPKTQENPEKKANG